MHKQWYQRRHESMLANIKDGIELLRMGLPLSFFSDGRLPTFASAMCSCSGSLSFSAALPSLFFLLVRLRRLFFGRSWSSSALMALREPHGKWAATDRENSPSPCWVPLFLVLFSVLDDSARVTCNYRVQSPQQKPALGKVWTTQNHANVNGASKQFHINWRSLLHMPRSLKILMRLHQPGGLPAQAWVAACQNSARHPARTWHAAKPVAANGAGAQTDFKPTESEAEILVHVLEAVPSHCACSWHEFQTRGRCTCTIHCFHICWVSGGECRAVTRFQKC